MPLREQIEELATRVAGEYSQSDFALFSQFKAALNRGEIRAAERDANGKWQTNAWVKRGILVGFRMGLIIEMTPSGAPLQFLDKNTYPIRNFSTDDRVRIVPGGSSIRDGAYIAPGVVCMPPMFVNAGAYVDEGTMIDSHALVGSCAQIGKRVHLSAAAQIGGVLEPAGAVPVIIEDDVIVGGNCGVYEGTIVREGAVLASGTIITGSTPVFDLVRGTIYRRSADAPLEIPAGAVVVPGSRAINSDKGRQWGLSLYAPIIVKYRDEKTDAATQLEEALR
ncbi:MAG TPA: 2,3,4,5-tetrahydropyridine-2,6-dicarboxylate N-succinyltransferase [Pyrinomonadaceae bacterium]|jgi:2,3,4,5-tetrahydropyridine-2,6-dicarboxylate N-succinyltransferase|nr:2,3,4,5-tetrahydropyridine-2,6-dicarboxylate N-succinyltransferase [Pyrinomonadaceae bacterium]